MIDRRKGYYRNGRFTGYCSHEELERAIRISARMKERERPPGGLAIDEHNVEEAIACARTQITVQPEQQQSNDAKGT